ncbi:MAG TPA: hypothetical protein VM536_03460, partial [Chloroflexia bacterium]|nr:hypothetical protein [Chloroflexia bacterium]
AYTGGAAGGGGGGIRSGGGNHSQDGAKINYFDKTQGQTPAAGSNGGGGGAVAPMGGGGESGGGGSAGGGFNGCGGGFNGGGGGFALTGGNFSQNPAALAATWGDGEPRSALIRRVIDGFNTDLPETLGGDAGTAKSVQTKELNMAGQFAWDPPITPAEEIGELTANRWSPSTDDFAAVPGGTVAVVPSFGHLLGAICSEADGSISRINLFTHANKGMVAFGGHIEKRTITRADVFLNTNGAGDNLTAMDPTSMSNLAQPGVFFEAPKAINGKKKFTVEDLRKKFAPGAVFVLYACHSGQDAAFLKQIAQFLGVKVIGFSPEIGYYPPAQSVPNKFQRAGEKIGLGFGGTPVTDWRGLISDSKAITATP